MYLYYTKRIEPSIGQPELYCFGNSQRRQTFLLFYSLGSLLVNTPSATKFRKEESEL